MMIFVTLSKVRQIAEGVARRQHAARATAGRSSGKGVMDGQSPASRRGAPFLRSGGYQPIDRKNLGHPRGNQRNQPEGDHWHAAMQTYADPMLR